MSVTTKAPITHLPTQPSPVVSQINVPVPAGNAARVVPAVTPGKRQLTIANSSVLIDPTLHTPNNCMDIINGSNIPGVSAVLDRYGNLVINGVNAVGGDATLLTHLGFQ